MTGFDRNRRFSIMAQAGTGSDDLLILAEQVLADSGDAVTVVTPPRVGMMMLRLREPELTLAAAVLDAAVEAAHPLTPDILAGLATLDEAERARQLAAWGEVAPTRVAFDEMR